MLNWWSGRAQDPSSNLEGDANLEPPETPAHVFAGRALKSALFGTPAPPPDDTYLPSPEKVFEIVSDLQKSRPQSSQLSPTKPPGILLTPGTATSRRKTVSFGNEVVDREVVAVRRARKTHESRKAGQQSSSRSDVLTKALENAREEKSARDTIDKPKNLLKSRPLLDFDADEEDITEGADTQKQTARFSGNQGLLQDMMRDDGVEADMTMDLNDPFSQSGRFWKAEFEKYHREAQEEMKKLLQYKQLAKNYAKKKDEDNLKLCETLKEEKRRVSQMEDRLAKLSKRIARAGRNGHDADKDSPELIEELARQTALAVQYKKQVEEFQATMESAGLGEKAPTITINPLLPVDDPTPHVKLLREEILRLQRSLEATKKEKETLQEENKKLSQDLLHADLKIEKWAEKYKERQQSFQQMREKQNESLDTLRKSYDHLKEQAKSQRRDAEQLLKKRHEQSVELKKEIASLRNATSSTKELQDALQAKTTEHSRVVAEYEIQIAELKRDIVLGAEPALDLRASIQRDPSLVDSFSKHQASMDSPAKLRESQIPIASQSISRPLKAAARLSRSNTPSESPPKKSSHVLSELINNASPSTIPPQLEIGPVQYTPAVHRFSDTLLSPNMELPSPEPSILPHQGRSNKQGNVPSNIYPSMVNFPPSPLKPIRIRTHNSDDVRSSSSRAQGEQEPKLSSSRITSLEDSRVRKSVPPERAAAAKARLEQKAEKKRAQEAAHGKENIRN